MSIKTPRPTPKFFVEQRTFSTKKEKAKPTRFGCLPPTPCPPRPPVKSYPPVSRVFQVKQECCAQAVSFRSSESSVLSPNYNQASQDLFFDQCFEIECKLGAGSFGEVFKVRNKENGKYYAVKRSRERFRGESDRRRKLEEVAKHESLPKHPNCVGFVKAWEEKQHLYIQTELCESSLNTFAENNHDIPETLVWNYLVDLLMAVKHLHDHDLVHMDIKPENIFISKNDTCKLGDFGLVIDLAKGHDILEAQEGDPKYLAPELLEGSFGKTADIYSLGITILELASDLDLPRGGEGWHQLREGKLPDGFLRRVSNELRENIKLMMEPNHLLRPTADQLLAIPTVRRVWKRRRRAQIFQQLKCYVYQLLNQLQVFVLLLLGYIFVRVKNVLPSYHETPKQRQNGYSHDWDQSFSDDDVFDDDFINISDNSMGAPLDNSTASESDNINFTKPVLPVRKSKTTTGAQQRKLQTVTPSRLSPRYSFTNRFSPDSNPNNCFHTDRSTTPINNTFQANNEPKLSIGPKNLMEAFEAASSDED